MGTNGVLGQDGTVGPRKGRKKGSAEGAACFCESCEPVFRMGCVILEFSEICHLFLEYLRGMTIGLKLFDREKEVDEVWYIWAGIGEDKDEELGTVFL